jgi:hypothetical protein
MDIPTTNIYQDTGPSFPWQYGPPEIYPFLGGPPDYTSASYGDAPQQLAGGTYESVSSPGLSFADGTPLGVINGTDIGAAADHPVSIAQYYSGYLASVQSTLFTTSPGRHWPMDWWSTR